MNRFFTLLLAASCLTAVGQVPDYVPTDGLTGWYGLDDHAFDSSPLQNHGAINGPFGVDDRFGNTNSALRFDVNAWSWGSGGHWVYIPFDEAFNTAQVTVSCWVRRNSGGLSWNPQPQAIAHRYQYGYNSPNGESWRLGMGNSNSEYGSIVYSDVVQQSPSPAINVQALSDEETPLSTWFHLAMTWDEEELVIYQNGQIVSSVIDADLVMNQIGNSGVSLGMSVQANGHWYPIDGDLDDFGMWSRALSPAEIFSLFSGSEPVVGCTDESACNFNAEATSDDDSCIPSGCMDAEACNYNEDAECESQACDYSCCPGPGCCSVGHYWDWEIGMCFDINPADINNDGCVQLNDLLDLLSAYGDCGAEELTWQCGDPLEYQGYDYETVQAGGQCWFAENLRNANYLNGDEIPTGMYDGEWGTISIGATSIYDDNDASLETFGRLYNFFVVEDSRAICPSGWHVPSDEEVIQLESHLGMTEAQTNLQGFRGGIIGQGLKSTTGWSGTGNGTNSSGLSIRPAGNRYHNGAYLSVGEVGSWWTSTTNVDDGSKAWYRSVSHDDLGIYRESDASKNIGFSIRCIKDFE